MPEFASVFYGHQFPSRNYRLSESWHSPFPISVTCYGLKLTQDDSNSLSHSRVCLHSHLISRTVVSATNSEAF
ncbi:hypothetical protein L1987_75272 [Smallanthus sonchifolius]|uniref:Uncharacterized protein n=1 Tax=Smallanthus sonchifolius TaxID=185202 RepID=A0ACB9A692_9ASTR|nr:hypothetical protein L1987_75272 [Smallanthus sonchifolius]